jgi:hypothetical protein
MLVPTALLLKIELKRQPFHLWHIQLCGAFNEIENDGRQKRKREKKVKNHFSGNRMPRDDGIHESRELLCGGKFINVLE